MLRPPSRPSSSKGFCRRYGSLQLASELGSRSSNDIGHFHFDIAVSATYSKAEIEIVLSPLGHPVARLIMWRELGAMGFFACRVSE